MGVRGAKGNAPPTPQLSPNSAPLPFYKAAQAGLLRAFTGVSLGVRWGGRETRKIIFVKLWSLIKKVVRWEKTNYE